MPYCEITTNKAIEPAQEERLRSEIVRIIELIPGKTENWIMTRIADRSQMSFGGPEKEPVAMISVKTFGDLTEEQYELLTKELCLSISALLDISQERIYVIYEPIRHWGWNGQNF